MDWRWLRAVMVLLAVAGKVALHRCAAAEPSYSSVGRPMSSPTRLPPITPPPLQLPDVELLAMRHNPAVSQAIARVQAARGEWLQVGLLPNPIVGAGEQQTGSNGLAEQDGVSFTQEIVTGRKLRLNREVVARLVWQLEQELEAQRIRVLTDARSAFYQVLIAQRQRLLADELVRIATLGVQSARQRNKGTEVEENDVLEALIELHKAEIDARRAVNRHLAAWRSLCAVVGLSDLALQSVEGDTERDFPELDWPTAWETIRRSSPEIAAAMANAERAKASVERAGVEPIPNILFEGLVNHRDNGIGGRPNGGFWFSVPVPVWNRNQGGIVRARSDAAVAAGAVDKLTLDLQQRLALLFERYDNARFQVTQFRKLILPAAAHALALTRTNYENGRVEYDDLLTSQRTNAQASLDYLDAVRELFVAEAELSGMTLTGSLRTP